MAQAESQSGRQPISPAVRRRLQLCLEAGGKASAQGSFDYATEMFTQCVKGDPANKIYAQSFLANLQKKYNNNKKGSKLAAIKGAGDRASLKKASLQKNWTGIIESGMEVLKLNPWDLNALSSMAQACEMLEFEEAELVYLKGALDANLNDPDLNRQTAKALARQGRFDEAIVCWHRVEKAKPKDVEAGRAIADLTVEKTIKHGKYDTSETSNEAKLSNHEDTATTLTPERQLERAIAKNPEDVNNYLQLAELHRSKDRPEDYEHWLNKALEVSGGELSIRERLEDLRVSRLREQAETARRRATSEKTQEAIDLYSRFRAELNNLEIEVIRSRVDRYPQNAAHKYDLAIRLQRAGKFADAIPLYQASQKDPTRKGVVLLRLGECFAQIKQYKLALSNAQAAVGEILDRDEDNKKQALYLAGKLAFALKEYGQAEQNLTQLAGLDFSYKDVAALLDKINGLRDSGGS
jgi:tetratricopeptide (TPR) repeat protein